VIPYIQARLIDWAEWSRMRSDGFYGIGGGKGFAYKEPMPVLDRGYYKRFSSERCLETEEGVSWLGLDEYRVQVCILTHYRDHPEWSAAIQADFLRMSLRTYWRRLETGHALLLGYFLDRAVGLMPQTEQLRLDKLKRATDVA
jgi:hypothetical protein